MPNYQSESNCCKADVNMAGVCMKCKNLCVEVFPQSPQEMWEAEFDKEFKCNCLLCVEKKHEFTTKADYMKDFIRSTITCLFELYKKRLAEETRKILKGIDQTEDENINGWWETSVGAEFGKNKLDEILAFINKK